MTGQVSSGSATENSNRRTTKVTTRTTLCHSFARRFRRNDKSSRRGCTSRGSGSTKHNSTGGRLPTTRRLRRCGRPTQTRPLRHVRCDRPAGRGENVLAVTLGNGWYNPLPLRMWGRHNLRDALTDRPAVSRRKVGDSRRRRHVGHNGERHVVEGGGGPCCAITCTWAKSTTRAETPGWEQAGFDDSTWRQAVCVEGPGGILQPRMRPGGRARTVAGSRRQHAACRRACRRSRT